MNRLLLKKAVHEAGLSWLACAAVMFGFCWIYVWLGSQLALDQVAGILENFRKFERFFPVPFEQIATYTGRIALCYEEPLVVFTMAIWAIGRGSAVVSGEISRGTMEMLLAQPVRRRQIVASQATVHMIGTTLLAGSAWLGICVGVTASSVQQSPSATSIKIPWLGFQWDTTPADNEPEWVPMREKVEVRHLLPGALNLCALGVFLGGVSILVSACDRYRWRTIGILVGILVVNMLLKVVARGSPRVAWLEYFSFFKAYEPTRFVSLAMNNERQAWHLLSADQQTWLGPLGMDLVLIALGLLAITIATVVFAKRDVPAPS